MALLTSATFAALCNTQWAAMGGAPAMFLAPNVAPLVMNPAIEDDGILIIASFSVPVGLAMVFTTPADTGNIAIPNLMVANNSGKGGLAHCPTWESTVAMVAYCAALEIPCRVVWLYDPVLDGIEGVGEINGYFGIRFSCTAEGLLQYANDSASSFDLIDYEQDRVFSGRTDMLRSLNIVVKNDPPSSGVTVNTHIDPDNIVVDFTIPFSWQVTMAKAIITSMAVNFGPLVTQVESTNTIDGSVINISYTAP